MSDTASPEFDIRFTTTRDVRYEDVTLAREAVIKALAHAPRPVLYAKAALSVLPDPAVPRPHLVHFQVDLNGLPVNAHAAGATMPEAINLASSRLRTRVENIPQFRETHHKAHSHAPGPGEATADGHRRS
ncbi:hypothetical protein [Actinomadura macra]|uniref:hypothetical protein n=1 Tax=Actinomadura macra TaxID=46164 RepID=UPI00082C2BDE|nr:hypothetical protein [Actinomadura macra]